jgi:hypothetical protein
MATIIIQGKYCRATLTEPDEDGEYNFLAACGRDSGWGVQPIGDMIMAAEMHVDACDIPAPLTHHPRERASE